MARTLDFGRFKPLTDKNLPTVLSNMVKLAHSDDALESLLCSRLNGMLDSMGREGELGEHALLDPRGERR